MITLAYCIYQYIVHITAENIRKQLWKTSNAPNICKLKYKKKHMQQMYKNKTYETKLINKTKLKQNR